MKNRNLTEEYIRDIVKNILKENSDALTKATTHSELEGVDYFKNINALLNDTTFPITVNKYDSSIDMVPKISLQGNSKDVRNIESRNLRVSFDDAASISIYTFNGKRTLSMYKSGAGYFFDKVAIEDIMALIRNCAVYIGLGEKELGRIGQILRYLLLKEKDSHINQNVPI